MKIINIAVVLFLIASWMPASAREKSRNRDTLFQVSTLGALLTGDYDGRKSFKKVKKRGDFGLGTFDKLNGELVAVDGEFYQVRHDGIPRLVENDTRTPFAAVTFFNADDTFFIESITNCSTLFGQIENRFPSNELIYAIKVTANFPVLKTRSVPIQEKPYVPLIKALEEQVIFDIVNVDATLVGFWFPSGLRYVNAAGFHFHVITQDVTAGGHLLECEVWNASVEIDYTNKLQVELSGMQAQH